MQRHAIPFFCIIFLMAFGIPVFSTNAVVTKYYTTVEKKKHSIENKVFVQILINNRAGEAFSEVELNFSPILKLRNLKGRIADTAGKTIRKLSKKEIQTVSDFSWGTYHSDQMVKQFRLLHNVYPYLIEFEYTTETDSYLNVEHWSPIYLKNISTIDGRLYYKVDREEEIKYFNENCNHKLTNINGEEFHEWKASFVADRNNEYYSDVQDDLASVSIISPEFQYVIEGKTESWSTLGEWYGKLTSNLGALSDAEKKKIDELTKKLNDSLEITKVLYHYLQDETHYVNISIEHGGMLPHPVKNVCDSRYGDCKDLATYMKAMLSYKGIQSNYVLINSGSKYFEVKPEIITSQFDHVILMIPNIQDTIWLECTSSFLPFGELGAFTQNRKGLLINGSKSKLVQTPKLSSIQVQNSFRYDFYLNSKEKAKLKGRVKRGIITSSELFKQLNSSNESDLLEELSYYIPIPNVQLTDFSFQSKNRDSVHTEFNYSASCPNPYYRIAKFVRIDHPYNFLPKFEKPNEREEAVRFFYPKVYCDTLVYHNDFSPLVMNSDSIDSEKSAYGMYKIHRSMNDSMLVVIREIILPIQKVPISNYPEFYDFTEKIHKQFKSSLTQLKSN